MHTFYPIAVKAVQGLVAAAAAAPDAIKIFIITTKGTMTHTVTGEELGTPLNPRRVVLACFCARACLPISGLLPRDCHAKLFAFLQYIPACSCPMLVS